MKNNEAKQKAIQEAYGEYWGKVKDYVNDNGFVWYEILSKLFRLNDLTKEWDYETIGTNNYYRPQSLQGIEDNNGWIKIESEKDLPINKGEVFVMSDMGIMTANSNLLSAKEVCQYWMQTVTHYQPIVKPKPPIY